MARLPSNNEIFVPIKGTACSHSKRYLHYNVRILADLDGPIADNFDSIPSSY